jgi:hypothetical protein
LRALRTGPAPRSDAAIGRGETPARSIILEYLKYLFNTARCRAVPDMRANGAMRASVQRVDAGLDQVIPLAIAG